MRYVVLGAGAVGGCIGFHLAEAGHRVLLIARGKHGSAICEHGLTLRGKACKSTREFECLANAKDYDYVAGDRLILCVKSQDVAAALADVDPDVPVFCAQNGVIAEQLAAKRSAKVYGMMTWLPALHLEPGVIQNYASGPAGCFRIGAYPNGMDPACEEFAEHLRQAGFDAQVVANIQRWKHGKLLLNLGNAIDAFAVPDPGFNSLLRGAIGEAQACLQVAGLEYMSAYELRETMERIVKAAPDAEGAPRPGGSTWQSIVRGQATETEHLNGWICDLGDRLGVRTPINCALARMALETKSPRSIPLEEVQRWVLEEDIGA